MNGWELALWLTGIIAIGSSIPAFVYFESVARRPTAVQRATDGFAEIAIRSLEVAAEFDRLNLVTRRLMRTSYRYWRRRLYVLGEDAERVKDDDADRTR